MATAPLARPEYDEHGNVIQATSARPEYDEHGNVIGGTTSEAQQTVEQPKGLPTETGAYQSRKGGPVLNVNEPAYRSGIRAAEGSFGINDPHGYWDALKQAGRSFGNFVNQSYHELDPISWTNPQFGPLAQGAIAVPHTVARMAEGMASGIEGATSDIESGVKRRDPRSIASGIGSLVAQKAQMEAPEAISDAAFNKYATNLSEAGRLVTQADKINKAQVQVVNSHVRQPLAQLEASVNNEIGQHVSAAVNADRAHMQATGQSQGLVNAAEALKGANAKLAAMGDMAIPQSVSGLLTEAARPLTLNDAKSLTTDVGRTASAMTRQGNLRVAAVLNELYDGLHKATQARADELGAGKSWQQYINLTRSFKGLQEGLMGELVDEPIHAKVMDKLIDPKRGTEWNELRDELAKRGIDTTSFEKARDYARQMSELMQTTSNLFLGKMRAIIKHPFTAGPIAIGASEVGHLSALPGMSFVLPLIAASKTAGLLDARAVMQLVKEIGKNVPPEMGRAREALPSPMTPQAGTPPATAPAEQPPPSGPKGGINPKGYEQSMRPVSLEDQIGALNQENSDIKERMRIGMLSDDETKMGDERMAENEQLIKELKAALKNKKKAR